MAEILVDGSNVLFWRAEQAHRDVPMLVVTALKARRFTPVLYFDNSVYRHLGADDLASLAASVEVIVVPQGTPADALLLEACACGRIQIVSCDRFQAWREDHPGLRRNWRVSGRIEKGGRVSFSKTLRAAPL